jgi:hypothetical protein
MRREFTPLSILTTKTPRKNDQHQGHQGHQADQGIDGDYVRGCLFSVGLVVAFLPWCLGVLVVTLLPGRFRRARNASTGRVLITSEALAQPRRATEIP